MVAGGAHLCCGQLARTIALPRQQQYLRSGRLSIIIAEMDVHAWWYEPHAKLDTNVPHRLMARRQRPGGEYESILQPPQRVATDKLCKLFSMNESTPAPKFSITRIQTTVLYSTTSILAEQALPWKAVSNWPYPVRPCAPKVRRQMGQMGSITPAKEKHELAHVVQSSGRELSFHTSIVMEEERVVALRNAPISVWSKWTVDQTQTPLSGRR